MYQYHNNYQRREYIKSWVCQQWLDAHNSLSSVQALYKLYNAAASHRHLYHHAFPGHQAEEEPEEPERRRDWWGNRTGGLASAQQGLLGHLSSMMDREGEGKVQGHHHPLGILLVWFSAGTVQRCIHYFKAQSGQCNVRIGPAMAESPFEWAAAIKQWVSSIIVSHFETLLNLFCL